MNTLTFQNTTFDIISRAGQVWLQSSQIAQALGYADQSSIRRIYDRNSDEFTSSMSETVKLTVSGNLQKEVRIFSLRGCHLLAMFARTAIAKQFRKWVLDILDAANATTLADLPKNPHLALRNTIHAAAKGNRQVYCNLYNSLYRKFQVTSYKDLDNAQCVAAVEFIKSVEGDYIARDKITPPKPSLALCDGQHYVVAKDGAVLMHKVLSHDINDSFLKQKATPCLSELQNVPLLTDKADYTQIRAALRQLVQVVDHYQPYSQVRPAVIVLETVERLLMRMWTMIDEASFRAAMVENYAKKGQPLKDYEHDTVKNISQILKQSMMMIDVPSFY